MNLSTSCAITKSSLSIWPVENELPAGWVLAGVSGSKAECLAYIEQTWTDMRPASLRRDGQDTNF